MVKRKQQSRRQPSAKADERRKHRRVQTPLKARFLDQYGDEYPCIVMNASAGGALLKAKTPPPAKSTIVLYIDQLGRFEARVIRSSGPMFAVNYETQRNKTNKTADNLTQVVNTGKRTHDRRATPRIRQDAPARVQFEDGRVESCAILDISLTGASIEISPRPPLGARLILGRMHAKVVRRHDKGVGVVFTGNADRMADVIEDAAPVRHDHDETVGAGVAQRFGKKRQQVSNEGTISMYGAENWCIKVDEKVYGPYTTEQRRKYAHEGRLAAWSLIAPAGSRSWREARRESTFATFFGSKASANKADAARSFGKRDQAADDADAAPSRRGRRKSPALANFVIVFDEAEGAASRLETAILGLGRAFRLADNVWTLTCDLTAVGVRNALAPYLSPREPIFVIDASRGRSSWQNYAPELHAKISSSYTGAAAAARAS